MGLPFAVLARAAASRHQAPQRVPTVWDTSFNTNPNVNYSNGNRDVVSSHFDRGRARTVFGASYGLWYFEFSPLGSVYAMPGIVNASLPPGNNYPGSTPDGKSIGVFADDGTIYLGGALVGDIGPGFTSDAIGVLLNAGTGQVAFKNATTTTAFFSLTHTPGDIYHAAFGAGASTTSGGRINSGQDAFVHGLPSGCEPIFGDY